MDIMEIMLVSGIIATLYLALLMVSSNQIGGTENEKKEN